MSAMNKWQLFAPSDPNAVAVEAANQLIFQELQR
jgi:hypothetical protein